MSVNVVYWNLSLIIYNCNKLTNKGIALCQRLLYARNKCIYIYMKEYIYAICSKHKYENISQVRFVCILVS